MSKIWEEIQKVAPSALIELFELDLTPKVVGSNNKYYFHAGTNKISASVVWRGVTYAAWPIEVTGFDKQVGGALPRVRVKLGNKNGLITSLALNFDDLLGTKLTRRRTFARFLDAVNFPGGVNAEADTTVELPDDIYFLERKINENRLSVELEFSSEFDVEGIMLPRRQVAANCCSWVYRGSECAYTGKPVADDFGNLVPVVPNDLSAPFNEWNVATAYVSGDVVWYLDEKRVFVCIANNTGQLPTNPAYWFEDLCGGRLSDCKLRPRAGDIYPFGGFPGSSRVPEL